jgi:hypothetical protein
MTLDHSLKNTGQKTIDTYVYDHDFFMFDGKPIGPGMSFTSLLSQGRDPGAAAKIEGKDLVYVDTLALEKACAGYLTGYSDRPSDWRLPVEDTNSKVGVQQTWILRSRASTSGLRSARYAPRDIST